MAGERCLGVKKGRVVWQVHLCSILLVKAAPLHVASQTWYVLCVWGVLAVKGQEFGGRWHEQALVFGFKLFLVSCFAQETSMHTELVPLGAGGSTSDTCRSYLCVCVCCFMAVWLLDSRCYCCVVAGQEKLYWHACGPV